MINDINLYKRLVKWIKPESKVLDIGCGDATLKDVIVGDYYGVDIKIQYDIEKDKAPYKKSSMDVVVMTEVLEHLSNHKHCFKEIKRVLKKDGIYIGSVPNVYSIEYMVGYFCGFHKSKWADDDMHVVAFDKNILRNLLESNGFKDVIVEKYRGYLIFRCKI